MLPYRKFPLGAVVRFPRDFSKPIGNQEQLIPAGTTAHVVLTEPDVIVVVPHVYMELVSNAELVGNDWKHEIQWSHDDHQDAGQRLPFELVRAPKTRR